MQKYSYRKFLFFRRIKNISNVDCLFFFSLFLAADGRVSRRASQQIMRRFFWRTGSQIRFFSGHRALARSFCPVSGFPRNVSPYLFSWSRHEFNRRAALGFVTGFRKC